MAWSDLATYSSATHSLQRGLKSGRLAHAYLLSGSDMGGLELFARTLAKTVNCLQPPAVGDDGQALDSCDACSSCRRIDTDGHPDVFWVRAESKSRLIRGEQITERLQSIYLKPNEARRKVNIIVAADRMNPTAANKFLKTLEEPPPDTLMVLLTTSSDQVLETIRSRCQRITLFDPESLGGKGVEADWLKEFSAAAAGNEQSILERYRLLGVLVKQLAELKKSIGEKLEAASPLERIDDIEPEHRERLEKELDAAIEAEYRRQRSEILGLLHWWLRDIWLHTLKVDVALTQLHSLEAATRTLAARLTPDEAQRNLEEWDRTQRLLGTNIQEALALEVGLIKLKL